MNTRAAAFKYRQADKARQPVRPAGKDAMRDPPAEWDQVDEVNDESFPASDPPARNTRGVKIADERVLKRAKRKFDEAKKKRGGR
jgi:hypothetical protein